MIDPSARAAARFTVVLPALSARLRRTVAVEVAEPTSVAFAGDIPDAPPASNEFECYVALSSQRQREAETEWERWQVRMVARCIVAPAFLKDPAQVEKLGADGKLLVKTVLDRWGIDGELKLSPAYLKMVRKIARTLRLDVNEVMLWPVSLFWNNWMVLFSPKLNDAKETPNVMRDSMVPSEAELTDEEIVEELVGG